MATLQSSGTKRPTGARVRGPAPEALPLSPGEVAFLRSFVQGSIMITETRQRLRSRWGMCERHAIGALAAEAAWRHGYLHGPAILYADLMDRAVRSFGARGPALRRQLRYRLRERGPCLICELGFGPQSEGFIAPDVLAAGRDPAYLREFVRSTEPHWADSVCGTCAGDGAVPRCRVHLLEALRAGAAVDLSAQRALVERIGRQMERFSRSFGWEERGTETPADRAALVSAPGWYGGWGALLALARAG
ncbi:MAG: hypothetical protein M0015_05445 [Betaproteobacteria bacterium]|nr:hypothetical protein [Betaproteobacteria bacterium]